MSRLDLPPMTAVGSDDEKIGVEPVVQTTRFQRGFFHTLSPKESTIISPVSI